MYSSWENRWRSWGDLRSVRDYCVFRVFRGCPYHWFPASLVAIVFLAWYVRLDAADPPAVTGALRIWQPVTIDFRGPRAQETDNAPNPFLDFRLQVLFT